MMNNKKNIENTKKEIEKSLHKYFSLLKGPSVIINAMKYSVFNGGKRLRPILAIEITKMLGGSEKKTLPTASAIELIHSFSLIHDDLPSMDNDDYRRGKPSCHKRFGEGLALLAGDALINMAFGIIAKDNSVKEVASMLSDAIGTSGMVGGQALDLRMANKKKISKRNKTKIDKMKTASLMAVSCGLGALLACAKKSDIKKAENFGESLGVAFQIADDLRDSEHKYNSPVKMKESAEKAISQCRKNLKMFNKRSKNIEYIIDMVQKRIYG
jgi:geranylgeranyl diphosphate synthase, type II